MTRKPKDLVAEALQLPVKERAELARISHEVDEKAAAPCY
jgi:hypothetical protein